LGVRLEPTHISLGRYTLKYQTKLRKLVKDIHSSLFFWIVGDIKKSFIALGPEHPRYQTFRFPGIEKNKHLKKYFF